MGWCRLLDLFGRESFALGRFVAFGCIAGRRRARRLGSAWGLSGWADAATGESKGALILSRAAAAIHRSGKPRGAANVNSGSDFDVAGAVHFDGLRLVGASCHARLGAIWHDRQYESLA